jgi:hypothetical protein
MLTTHIQGREGYRYAPIRRFVTASSPKNNGVYMTPDISATDAVIRSQTQYLPTFVFPVEKTFRPI